MTILKPETMKGGAKMKRTYIAAVAALAMIVSFGVFSHAQRDSSDFLKEGVVGAGSGLVGGLASGAKGKDVWKGALAGAGVSLLGSMLLDNHSGEQVASHDDVKSLDSTDAYKQGYQDGYQNGYKQGYTQGYKEGLHEGVKGKD